MLKKWTETEDEILATFWRTDRPSDEAIALLPGRTLAAIKHRAHQLKCRRRGPGPRPQMEKNVAKMIKKQGPICTADMARMLLCKPQQVDQYVRRLHKAKKIHVSGFVERSENHLSRLWTSGQGLDAIKPTKFERAPWQEIAPSKPTFVSHPLMAALYGRAA